MVAHGYSPSAREAETAGSRFCWLLSLDYLVSSRQSFATYLLLLRLEPRTSNILGKLSAIGPVHPKASAPDAVSHIPCGDPKEPLRLEMMHYKRQQPQPAGRACLSCVPVTVCSEHASEIAEASEF